MTIFWIFASLTLLGLTAYALQILAVRSYLRETERRRSGNTVFSSYCIPVSILKPLKGLDDNLFDNLESFCVQDYPEYESIFSLQDYNDPAYKVARKIKEKYPHKDVSLIVEECNAGLNPKVNNLIPAFQMAKYELTLISDSNVLVKRDYLREIVKHFSNPDIGLVTNLIRGVSGRTLGSVFENLHLNTFIMGSICFLDRFLKMPCVVGKSMLMRKEDLLAIGGFRSVKDVLAEDYIMGKKMQKRGRKVIVSSYFIDNVNQYWGLKKFLNRHTRWGKLRWKIGGIRYFSELISNSVFMACLPVFLFEPSKLTGLFAILVSCIKVTGDFYIGRKIKAEMNPFLYLLSPLKDLIVGIIWVIPIISNTVVWRGNRYIIGKDSGLSPCTEFGIWSWRYRVMDAIRGRFA
jgi:ceramide glucosyltransferase